MSDDRRPVFVEKAGYRRRRLADAARLLPIAGAILFLIPLLWRRDAGAAASTTAAMLYVFGIWLVLVLLAALISHFLPDDDQHGDTPDRGER